MASTIPTGVNPCLRDYTEYLSDKTGLKEHVLFDLLNQYVQERGAQQPGVYLDLADVPFTTTEQGTTDESTDDDESDDSMVSGLAQNDSEDEDDEGEDDEDEDVDTAGHSVPTIAPTLSTRPPIEATRIHFNELCTKRKILPDDQLQIPQTPTFHADGAITALNDVYAVMQYVSQGSTASVSVWVVYCPALGINGANIVGKGPEVFRSQLELLGFVGPKINKWSNTVRVFRGGVFLGTVTEVKERFLA